MQEKFSCNLTFYSGEKKCFIFSRKYQLFHLVSAGQNEQSLYKGLMPQWTASCEMLHMSLAPAQGDTDTYSSWSHCPWEPGATGLSLWGFGWSRRHISVTSLITEEQRSAEAELMSRKTVGQNGHLLRVVPSVPHLPAPYPVLHIFSAFSHSCRTLREQPTNVCAQ